MGAKGGGEATFAHVNQTGISAVLRRAVSDGHFPYASAKAENENTSYDNSASLKKPVALLYDLDAWEGAMIRCRDGFGPGCLHALAIKSNPVAPFLKTALELGFGLECASIGEVLNARSVGCPVERIVYDSPSKTRAELAYCLRHGIHMNIDNFEELKRIAEIRRGLPTDIQSSLGMRLNPMAGAGAIAALSVSVADSKFGVSVHEEERLLAAYVENPWLNSIHVHVGSGFKDGTGTLVSGVKTAVEFTKKINKRIGRRQVSIIDIGGGLGVDYMSDACPDHVAYAADLRREIPGLLREVDGSCATAEPLFDKVITEFGQSLNGKSGWLASRAEYVKATADKAAQIAVIHFGADVCPRQCYTKDHERAISVYDGGSCKPLTRARSTTVGDDGLPSGDTVTTHIAGPLCFQGDFLVKGMDAPTLCVDDFVVMVGTGANCLSLFSRHCSRFAPTVLGYRLRGDKVTELTVMKPAESVENLLAFWGGGVSEDVKADTGCSSSSASRGSGCRPATFVFLGGLAVIAGIAAARGFGRVGR